MKNRLTTILAVLVGLAVTGVLVAASIWPVVNVVETGETPEYPEIQPQYYTAEPKRVYDEAVAAIESARRWKVAAEHPRSRRIEATHETWMWGFIDDVTVWVEPVTEYVTRVRVRSASRVGKGDFGQNARNIRAFFRALDARIGGVKFDPSKRGDRSGRPAAGSRDAGSDQPDAE